MPARSSRPGSSVHASPTLLDHPRGNGIVPPELSGAAYGGSHAWTTCNREPTEPCLVEQPANARHCPGDPSTPPRSSICGSHACCLPVMNHRARRVGRDFVADRSQQQPFESTASTTPYDDQRTPVLTASF